MGLSCAGITFSLVLQVSIFRTTFKTLFLCAYNFFYVIQLKIVYFICASKYLKSIHAMYSVILILLS